jgi:hypothetical protein
MATITAVIAWGDLPTWLLVAATAIGGAALLWQLVLQRRQLKEQQLIVAQQVRAERRDVYAQLLAASGNGMASKVLYLTASCKADRQAFRTD